MSNITRYSVLQQKLHWVVVVLVGLQYLLQSPMRAAMAAYNDNIPLSGIDFLVTTLHTWGGAVIGVIMVYRFWLRVQKPVEVGSGRLQGLAHLAVAGLHWGFYGLLFFMVVTGVLHYYFELHGVAKWHEWGEWLLLGMILVHILAALLHHLQENRPPH